MHRGSRLGLRRSVSEQIFSTGSWRAARHQEFVDAAEEVFAEPAAEFATGMGSRVYRMRPQLSQRKTSSLVSVASSCRMFGKTRMPQPRDWPSRASAMAVPLG